MSFLFEINLKTQTFIAEIYPARINSINVHLNIVNLINDITSVFMKYMKYI